MAQKVFEASIYGGDSIRLTADVVDGKILNGKWSVIGRVTLLEEAQQLKNSVQGDIAKLSVPSGKSPSQLLLKQLILKIKGEWPNTSDPELCHCRKIPQSSVERAVILGANTVDKIRQRTSANTGCGTCLPDVESILALYLG